MAMTKIEYDGPEEYPLDKTHHYTKSSCGKAEPHEWHLHRGSMYCRGLKLVEESPEKVETTDELLASRRQVYGDRVKNMERTAQLWSALLGIQIFDWQVPLLMSAYKMLRTFETPDYSDNSDDIDGWKKMFVEVMDANYEGIVQARTVEEYQLKKETIAASKPKVYTPSEQQGRIENYQEQLAELQKDNQDYFDGNQELLRKISVYKKRIKELEEPAKKAAPDIVTRPPEGSGDPYANVIDDEPEVEATPDDAWSPAEDQRCSWRDTEGRQCVKTVHSPRLSHSVRNINTRQRGE